MLVKVFIGDSATKRIIDTIIVDYELTCGSKGFWKGTHQSYKDLGFKAPGHMYLTHPKHMKMSPTHGKDWYIANGYK